MTGITDNPEDSCIHEVDPATGQNKCYLVLPDGQRKQLVHPVRRTYRHLTCGTTTTMSRPIAETYAARPSFYGRTFCVHCGTHLPVGAYGEFVWTDCDPEGEGTLVGTVNMRPEDALGREQMIGRPQR